MSRRYIFGKWQEANSPLTVEEAENICRQAERQRLAMASYPIDKILRVLQNLGDLWSNPNYPFRRELESSLPEITGFSPAMIEMAMQELKSLFDAKSLRKKLNTELKNYPRQGDFSQFDAATNTRLSWHPLGTLLHILSGNVFLVGAGSLIEGLITGNVNILKMSSGETVFMPLLIESLQEADPDKIISNSIALINYNSKQLDVMNVFKGFADGIIVWGGEEAVKTYRQNLPARTRLVIFGPKLSVGIVTAAGAAETAPAAIAKNLALELSIWDQNACTAPQVCFVEGMDLAEKICVELHQAMAEQTKLLPPGDCDVNTAVEIQKWRGLYEVAESRGEAKVYASEGDLNWTIILDKKLEMQNSPLHRTLRIVPFSHITDVINECIIPMRSYVQTVGLVSGLRESEELQETLGHAGVLRIMELGEMSVGGQIDDPHDGLYDLPQLMNCVVSHIKPKKAFLHPQETRSLEQKQRDIDEKLREVAAMAGFKIDGLDDLAKIQIKSAAELRNQLPQISKGGYVTRSGGSTGEPKFSYLNQQDWKNLLQTAVRQFQSMGIKSGDRIANFMLAGDLYGSFVSFDHINQALGAVCFNFAQQQDPELFLKIAKAFNINVVEAMPSNLMPLLRKVHELDEEFSLDTVVYAGMPMSESDISWLRNILKVKRVASVIGTTETGQYAYQCEHQSGRIHHLVDDFTWVEIVDTQGNEVPVGTEGEIVLTMLQKTETPILRFAVGDKGRILNEACPCGRTERVLEFLGRADDVVAVGLMNFSYRDLQASLSDYPTSLVQLVVDSNTAGETITGNIEISEVECFSANEIKSTVFKKIPLIKKRLSEGSLAEFNIQLFSPGKIPRNPRTGKVKLIVDKRLQP